MSRGQKQRIPANFPKMKDRAVGRRARKAQREAWQTLLSDPDFFPRLGRALAEMAEALGIACARIGRAFNEAMAEAARGLQFPRQLQFQSPALELRRNPEDAVIDAINGLEADEIGERVRWQLEQGMKRGDHLRDPWARRSPTIPIHAESSPGGGTISIAPAGTLPPDLGGEPAAWHPIGEITGGDR